MLETATIHHCYSFSSSKNNAQLGRPAAKALASKHLGAFLRVKQTGSKEPLKKNGRILSTKSWLFNSDSYNGLLVGG